MRITVKHCHIMRTALFHVHYLPPTFVHYSYEKMQGEDKNEKKMEHFGAINLARNRRSSRLSRNPFWSVCVIAYAFLCTFLFFPPGPIYASIYNVFIPLHRVKERLERAISDDRDFVEISNNDRRQTFTCYAREKWIIIDKSDRNL